ncbi:MULTISPECIES: hypothetical protein [unclassified Microcoleus]|uniref:hypothetical protein n=1 Tax=unclassified Microcoleus TaxID=2642155 RepID=UPI002FD0C18E
MRILQIIPSISLVYGGPSQMVLGLSDALASRGIELTIITTDSNGDIGQHPLYQFPKVLLHIEPLK